jgi:AraC-like DNA-binding protein
VIPNATTMLRVPPPPVDDPVPGPAYREAPPPTGLAPVVTCLWTRMAAEDAPTTRVVPDGCLDLMWITEGGTSRLIVAGPDTRAHLSTLDRGGSIAGVRFAPGAAAGVLGVPVHALRDERAELANLWGRTEAESLAAATASSATPALALAEAVAARRPDPPDAAMRHVARTLRTTHDPSPVRALAADVGLSERQLHRRCTAAFGYGPKVLHRVLRFQTALALARAGHDLARVAHVCGYADQPHLARDVAELAGTTLTALLGTRGRRGPASRSTGVGPSHRPAAVRP